MPELIFTAFAVVVVVFFGGITVTGITKNPLWLTPSAIAFFMMCSRARL